MTTQKVRAKQTSIGLSNDDFDAIRKICPRVSMLSNTALVQYGLGLILESVSPVAQTATPVPVAHVAPAAVVTNNFMMDEPTKVSEVEDDDEEQDLDADY
jgi:hypothetical protein